MSLIKSTCCVGKSNKWKNLGISNFKRKHVFVMPLNREKSERKTEDQGVNNLVLRDLESEKEQTKLKRVRTSTITTTHIIIITATPTPTKTMNRLKSMHTPQ